MSEQQCNADNHCDGYPWCVSVRSLHGEPIDAEPHVCRVPEEVREEIIRLRQWVSDCQAGMYINCVYCGHRYGPDDEVPATMAEVLKEHIASCPEHPMSALRKQLDEVREAAMRLLGTPGGSPEHITAAADLRRALESK